MYYMLPHESGWNLYILLPGPRNQNDIRLVARPDTQQKKKSEIVSIGKYSLNPSGFSQNKFSKYEFAVKILKKFTRSKKTINNRFRPVKTSDIIIKKCGV